MIHKLKIKEEFAEAILTGDKTFEVRLNDRGFQRHDRVRFTVIDNINVPHVSHPLHGKTFAITYVLSGWGIKEDYVVFGIKEMADAG